MSKKTRGGSPLVSFGAVFGRIADRDIVRRRNERFAFLALEGRPSLPTDALRALSTVKPKSIAARAKRILGRR